MLLVKAGWWSLVLGAFGPPLHRLYRMRRVDSRPPRTIAPVFLLLVFGNHDPERGAEINFVLLFLHDDRPQGFAQRKFSHCLRLADAFAVLADRDLLVF